MALDGEIAEVIGPEAGIGFGDKIAVELFHNDRDRIVHFMILLDIISSYVINYSTTIVISQEVTQVIFNDRLKILRSEFDLTQDKVAKELDMPVRTYQRLERDGAKTHYDTLIKLADFYDVSVDWLMGRTDKREVNR